MISSDKQTAWNSTFILHRSLLEKNQQLKACVDHLRRLPYEKAIRQSVSVSQRLIATQNLIQDIDTASTKLQRETLNLDLDAPLLEWSTEKSDMDSLP